MVDSIAFILYSKMEDRLEKVAVGDTIPKSPSDVTELFKDLIIEDQGSGTVYAQKYNERRLINLCFKRKTKNQYCALFPQVRSFASYFC